MSLPPQVVFEVWRNLPPEYDEVLDELETWIEETWIEETWSGDTEQTKMVLSAIKAYRNKDMEVIKQYELELLTRWKKEN